MGDRGRAIACRRPHMRACLPLLLLLCAWGASATGEAAAPAMAPATAPTTAKSEEVALEVFSAARVVDPVPPAYPNVARLDGREGWVVLDCVVDESGALTDVTVRGSTGQKEFEDAAVAWMRANRIEPARIGERAVLSSFPYKVTFRLRGEQHGARPAFVRAYRRLQGALEAKDRATAEAELARLEVENLYEDAYFHMARFRFATNWGSAPEQISALKAAIANEKYARYLPRAAFTAAARALFVLQVAQSDFGAALASYELLDPTAQAEPAIASAVAALRILETDARAFQTQGTIDARGFWSTRLLKQRFSIEPTAGVIPEFRLRCERSYLVVKLDPELTYTRNAGAGKCEIEVHGTPGTTFTLEQS
jgi:TonB family protein